MYIFKKIPGHNPPENIPCSQATLKQQVNSKITFIFIVLFTSTLVNVWFTGHTEYIQEIKEAMVSLCLKFRLKSKH